LPVAHPCAPTSITASQRGSDPGRARIGRPRSGSTRARSCPPATRGGALSQQTNGAWVRSTPRRRPRRSRRSPRTRARRGPSAAVARVAAGGGWRVGGRRSPRCGAAGGRRWRRNGQAGGPRRPGSAPAAVGVLGGPAPAGRGQQNRPRSGPSTPSRQGAPPDRSARPSRQREAPPVEGPPPRRGRPRVDCPRRPTEGDRLMLLPTVVFQVPQQPARQPAGHVEGAPDGAVRRVFGPEGRSDQPAGSRTGRSKAARIAMTPPRKIPAVAGKVLDHDLSRTSPVSQKAALEDPPWARARARRSATWPVVKQARSPLMFELAGRAGSRWRRARAIRLAAMKLPVRTKVSSKREGDLF